MFRVPRRRVIGAGQDTQLRPTSCQCMFGFSAPSSRKYARDPYFGGRRRSTTSTASSALVKDGSPSTRTPTWSLSRPLRTATSSKRLAGRKAPVRSSGSGPLLVSGLALRLFWYSPTDSRSSWAYLMTSMFCRLIQARYLLHSQVEALLGLGPASAVSHEHFTLLRTVCPF